MPLPLLANILQHVRSEIVSDAAEHLILVDSNDLVLGSLDKQTCHDGQGVLHRAFSLFVFNAHGHLLLQKRAPQKRLWPEFWSNSCCSHPRQGETMEAAVLRRSEQELGFSQPVEFVYKFEYQASYLSLGSEHELCSVFISRFNGEPNINATEIMDWRWCPPQELEVMLNTQPQLFTPWFKLEWQRLSTEFGHRLPAQPDKPPKK